MVIGIFTADFRKTVAIIESGGWEHYGSSHRLHSEQDCLSLLHAQTHCRDWVAGPDTARKSRVAEAETQNMDLYSSTRERGWLYTIWQLLASSSRNTSSPSGGDEGPVPLLSIRISLES